MFAICFCSIQNCFLCKLAIVLSSQKSLTAAANQFCSPHNSIDRNKTRQVIKNLWNFFTVRPFPSMRRRQSFVRVLRITWAPLLKGYPNYERFFLSRYFPWCCWSDKLTYRVKNTCTKSPDCFEVISISIDILLIELPNISTWKKTVPTEILLQASTIVFLLVSNSREPTSNALHRKCCIVNCHCLGCAIYEYQDWRCPLLDVVIKVQHLAAHFPPMFLFFKTKKLFIILNWLWIIPHAWGVTTRAASSLWVYSRFLSSKK